MMLRRTFLKIASIIVLHPALNWQRPLYRGGWVDAPVVPVLPYLAGGMPPFHYNCRCVLLPSLHLPRSQLR